MNTGYKEQQLWSPDNGYHGKSYQNDYVSFIVFQEVIKRLETRLDELELRVDNRESISQINQQYSTHRTQNNIPSNIQLNDIHVNSYGLDDGTYGNRSNIGSLEMQDTSLANE